MLRPRRQSVSTAPGEVAATDATEAAYALSPAARSMTCCSSLRPSNALALAKKTPGRGQNITFPVNESAPTSYFAPMRS